MHSSDTRGSDLRTFDAVADELSHHYDARLETGRSVARRDIQRLSALADRLGREVTGWSRVVGDLEAGAARPLDAPQAARLLIESVFDRALIPEATRVLAAALAVAWPSR